MSTARDLAAKAHRVGRTSNGMLMTPEEYDAVNDYDDRYRYELIHGVLVVSPFASPAERDPNGQLEYLLRSYKATHPQGSTLDRTLMEQYVALPDSRRRADRVIWTGLGRVPDEKTDEPSIVVEFVSKATRDRTRDYVEKRRDYLELGVADYWVIDRFRQTMTVFRKPPAEPVELVLDAKATYHAPSLPGFELKLAELLDLANDWSRKSK